MVTPKAFAVALLLHGVTPVAGALMTRAPAWPRPANTTTGLVQVQETCRSPTCRRVGCDNGGEDCCTGMMMKMLTDVTNYLDKQGVEYMVTFGTLLGGFRDSAIIPWTADVDIYIPKKAQELLVSQTEIPYKFFYSDILRGCPDNADLPPRQWTYDIDDAASGDSNHVFYYLDFYTDDFFAREKQEWMPCSEGPPSTVTIQGQQFKTVRDPKKCLEQRYGADFMTPKKENGNDVDQTRHGKSTTNDVDKTRSGSNTTGQPREGQGARRASARGRNIRYGDDFMTPKHTNEDDVDRTSVRVEDATDTKKMKRVRTAHDGNGTEAVSAKDATKQKRASSFVERLLAQPSDDPTVQLSHIDFPAETLLLRLRKAFAEPRIQAALTPTKMRYEMHVVPVLVVLTLALHAWLAKLVDAGQGGVTADNVAAFTAYGLYVGLALVYQFLFRVAETTGVEGLSATSIVGAALVLKLLLSVGLYVREGRDAWSEIVEERGTLLRCAIPGIAYVLSDALRAYCLMNMDMSAFTMVYSLRTVGIAVLWVLIFSTSLSWLKWVALAVMALGNLMHRSMQWTSDGDVVSKEASTYLYELALLSVFLACVGSVVNELLLKSRSASINLQNCAMYIWGLVGLCMVGPAEGISWNPVMWFHLGYIGFAAMLVYALHGIATSRLLKYLGNIWKETAIACNVVFSFVIEVCVFKTEYAAFAVGGVVVVFIGMSMFILDGPARKSADGNPPAARRSVSSEPPTSEPTSEPREEQLSREPETTQ